MSSKNNTNTGLLIGAGAIAVFILSKSGALTSLTSSTSTPGTTATSSPNTVIDAAGTLQKDVVNGRANFSTEIANHPELKNPGYIMTQAQRAQLLTNYNDLRQAMQIYLQQNPQVGNIYNAVQKWWTDNGNNDNRTFFALIPSDNTPYAPPPSTASNSSGGGSFWSGLLGDAMTVVTLIAGIGDLTQPPELGDIEIQILVTGSAFVKGILPFFEEVQPEYVSQVDDKIDNLVNYYLGIS